MLLKSLTVPSTVTEAPTKRRCLEMHKQFTGRESPGLHLFSIIISFLMEAGKKAESCDYTPLKACLDKNNNDRSKCLKEWDEFQKACREKK